MSYLVFDSNILIDYLGGHADALNGWNIVTRNPDDFTPLAKLPVGYQNIEIIVPYILAPSS